jgi:hypothetical protein
MQTTYSDTTVLVTTSLIVQALEAHHEGFVNMDMLDGTDSNRSLWVSVSDVLGAAQGDIIPAAEETPL